MASLIKELHEVKLSLGDGEKIIYPEEQLSDVNIDESESVSSEINPAKEAEDEDNSQNEIIKEEEGTRWVKVPFCVDA